MKFLTFFAVLMSFFTLAQHVQGATPRPSRVASPSAIAAETLEPASTESPVLTPIPRLDITQKTDESVGPLEKIIKSDTNGPVWKSPLKHALLSAVDNGVAANTLVLLLLLPVAALFVAATRHLIGLQGFGILLPTALSIAFLAVGPIVGIGLFLAIVVSSTLGRVFLRRIHLRLHYLPRMSLLLSITVVAVLAILVVGSSVPIAGITNVSIFPVLFLVVLSEDFTRVQLGKSFNTALNITTQTLLLAVVSYFFLTLQSLQEFAIKNPEGLIGGVVVLNIILGKFSGLRVLEYWRFRKLIRR